MKCVRKEPVDLTQVLIQRIWDAYLSGISKYLERDSEWRAWLKGPVGELDVMIDNWTEICPPPNVYVELG